MKAKPWDARVAARFVGPLTDTPVHPNHLTGMRLAIGIGGAICFARGDAPNLAAWLIVASNFIDHADGELARMSGKSSRFGHHFDLVSDALVTIGMFIGIGIGLEVSDLGARGMLLGLIAGVAVAGIFQFRLVIENRYGKNKTRQPGLRGFELEDVLYLMPIVTGFNQLEPFLIAAAVGTPVALLVVALQFVMISRSPPLER